MHTASPLSCYLRQLSHHASLWISPVVLVFGILHDSGHIYLSGCSIPLVTKHTAGKNTDTGNKVKGLPSVSGLIYSGHSERFHCAGVAFWIIKLLAHWKLFLIYLRVPHALFPCFCTTQTFRKYVLTRILNYAVLLRRLLYTNKLYRFANLW